MGITLFLLNHCLKKQYNLFHITVTSLLEGIPMGPDPAPFFCKPLFGLLMTCYK